MELVPVVSAFLPVLVFMLVYHALARWWKTPEGRNIMALSLIIMLFAGVIWIRRAGYPDAALIMTNTLFILVGVVYIRRTVLLLRAQGFLGHKERRHSEPADRD